jgi:hypothetical protein
MRASVQPMWLTGSPAQVPEVAHFGIGANKLSSNDSDQPEAAAAAGDQEGMPDDLARR